MSPVRRAVLFRTGVAIAVGAIVVVAVGPVLGWAAGLLAGWAGAAATNVAWVSLLVWPMDGPQTREHATGEDPGRSFARLVALIGSIASLGAVVVVLIQTQDTSELESYLLAAIAVVSVAASWALIQSDYMLRYAHLYYSAPVGGIDFNQEEDPSYTDFVYFSVGIGMGYQVGDSAVRTNAIRRLVIAQSLVAYLFGAVIIGTVVNLVIDLG
ncbi:DUF1345 domain-containing protein [Microbacterium sp. zg.B48]|uniref:DUF1345 domain-containing protein n=1 Tax=unclassified Microbacterium TaxID=2609290 RepID=UPI00214CF2B5|nr:MULTISPECIES: DUF1345 domain-containing protein [unclassified Microbacterium]MCR2762254.1 DUF1345 domain-containing protein [Microbacterium sp. zg.B48]MCR2809739.1 DUF1345 domain-containing protein [Microbacterium sp. zg.B185]WIM17945.1 DUF1345 domain-containing protein [Microbacterium sp. zg-B185]